ncbi:hypothetical protein CR152_04435 [Massilia violaceinigra]|uniref:Uncharacterized protein n=1 Tax=Massilia violaceinigra TaxID=2045208 RepID=A0A2D2DFU2_9BURK|nr:hypothetical protein [Massilia violaceinigra]ATQ73846.1 hypothetical protein CR152_04435 [Massilia violaceinigra]
MNNIFRTLIAMLLIWLTHAFAKPIGKEPAGDVAEVSYAGFEIEIITGVPEHQIREYGCAYTISEKEFLNLLLRDLSSTSQYDKRDVRAVITLADGRKYFVNRLGLVRNGKAMFKLDPRIFEEHLSLVKPGKCR